MKEKHKIISETGHIFIEDWKKYAQNFRKLSNSTILSYSRDLFFFLAFIENYKNSKISIRRLEKITVRDFRSWLTHEIKLGTSTTTLRRYLSSVKEFYNWLNEKKGVNNKSILNVQMPKKENKLPRPIEENYIFEIISLTEKNHKTPWIAARNASIFTLLYGCGLRISEALNIKRNNFPFTGTLKIVGKGGKERIIPVVPFVEDSIKRYIDLCPFVGERNEFLFLGAKGKKLDARIIQKEISNCRKHYCKKVPTPTLRHPPAFSAPYNSSYFCLLYTSDAADDP